MTVDVFAPGGGSYLLGGGATGCVLVHGFTAMPAELRPLGDALQVRGHTVFGLRMPGHGTHPEHLAETRWHHHVSAAADAVGLLRSMCDRVVVVGTSMGAIVALSPELAGADARVALAMPTCPGEGDARDTLTPKGTEVDPVFGIRRERDFPAYGMVPERHIGELLTGWRRMWEHLPNLTGPVQMVHSDADAFFPVESMQRVAGRMTSASVETHVVHGLGHAMVLDAGGGEVIDLVVEFAGR